VVNEAIRLIQRRFYEQCSRTLVNISIFFE